MRIVYLNPCGTLGGAETSIRELWNAIRVCAKDCELWLVLGEDGPLAAEARALGVQVELALFPPALARLGDSSNRTLALARLLKAAIPTARYRRRLAKLLRSLQPDVLHTNGLKMHVLGAWTRPRRTRLIWHIHDYVSTRPMMSRLLRMCHRACAVAIANSKGVANDLHSLIPDLRIVPIYNAVDLSRFSPTGPKINLDTAAGLPAAAPGTVRVGLIATFARWKGQKVFLEALARLSGESIRGFIIGAPIYQTDGSQWTEEELQRESIRLGLSGKVGFTGYLKNTPAAIRSLDIIVHASTQPEPFGMVIIEAMASGTPVIASQAGGAAELFVPGENALAHAPGDAVGLAAQILALARDGTLRQRLGRAGRATAERRFPGRRFADEVLNIYRETNGTPLVEAAVPTVASFYPKEEH